MAVQPARRPGRTRRRRQRSVRVSVAVTLLGTATALVLVALPTQSPAWLSVSSVLALGLSWGALRIMWTEVLQSRRENAADRAAAAKAYRELFTLRSAEHAELTTAMTERLAEAHLSRRELEGELAQSRRETAELRSELDERQVQLVVADQGAVALTQPDEVDQVDVVAGLSGGAVADLVAWEEQRQRSARSDGRPSRRRA